MMRWFVLWLSALVLAAPAQALTPAQALALATGDTASRIAALNALVAVPDDKTVALIQALSDDAVKVTDSAVFVIKDDKGFDPVTGAEVPVPESAEDVINNNQMRTELGAALALVGLQSPDTKTRLDAVKTLASDPSEDKLPLIEKAYAAEQVPAIKEALGNLRFALLLGNADKAKRLEAAEALGESGTPATKLLLSERLKVETDAEVKAALSAALVDIDARLAWGERLGVIFTGISLGSILLLVALGLAITYGLMGVINMAHGELMMIGAYATYVVQNLFRTYLPGAFDFYVIAAIPVSFLAAALVGAVLERGVIRWLYGRPLETLLATWGISLILMQAVRNIFGAQNVPVENPAWLSGGFAVMSNLTLPYNRIAIIIFAGLVLAGVAALIAHTRLGPVRARRDAEPQDGGLHGRQHRAHRHLCLRAGLGHRRAGRLRAVAGGQCRARPGPELHRRLVHGGGAGRRRPAGRHGLRRAGPGRAEQAARRLAGRGAGQDHGAGVHRHLHPEAAAGHLRDEGPERGGMSPARPPEGAHSRLAGPAAGRRVPT